MNTVTVIMPIYEIKDPFTRTIKEKLRDCGKIVLIYNEEALADKLKELFCDYGNVSFYKYDCQTEWIKVCNSLVEKEEYKDSDILILGSNVNIYDGLPHTLHNALYSAEKHGIVCPRMNEGRFAIIPKQFCKTITCTNFTYSYEVWNQVHRFLPEYTVIPWVDPSCLLIKREVIDLLGLFDEAFKSFHSAVADFCIRINKYGYSSIMSNQSFVYHDNICQQKETYELSQDLLKKHPRLLELEQQYLDRLISTEYFAELLHEGLHKKKRVLLNICSLTPFYSGTAEYQKNLLKEFCSLYSDKYEICILVNEAADRFHKISHKYENVFYPESLEGIFHIGLFASQIVNVSDIKTMNRHCLRYVFTLQDIIFLRRSFIMIGENVRIDTVLRMAMKYADGIIGISKYSLDDTFSYFGSSIGGEDLVSKARVIYDAVEEIGELKKINCESPFDGDYALIFGRDSPYKFINEALDIAGTMPHFNFVVVGLDGNKSNYNNVKCYQTGNLSEDMIVGLYEKATLVIFPSLYEGFGIPVFDAFKYGKRVIVKNNELNREIKEQFNGAFKYMLLYNDLNDLRALIESAMVNNDKLSGYNARNWRDVAVETEDFLSELLDNPINVDRLNERWYYTFNLKSSFGQSKIGTKEFIKIAKVYTRERINKFKSKFRN